VTHKLCMARTVVKSPTLAVSVPRLKNVAFVTCTATLGYSALQFTTSTAQCAEADSKPVLSYFDARGRAEIIRLLLAEAGVDYVDNRVNGQAFSAMKGELPYGQLPVLEVNGEILAQSQAIARYIARKYGLYGTTPEEGCRADMVVDGVADVVKAQYAASDPAAQAKFWDESFTKWATNTEKLLKKNDNASKSGYFVGNEVSLADISVFTYLDSVLRTKSDVLDKFPVLKANYEKVKSRPKIAQWLKTRPDTKF